MPRLLIDGRAIDAPPGATLLAAARAEDIPVPSLCARDGLDHVTSCMVCVVEDCATGALRTACSTPAEDGMRIATASPAALDERRAALELLLSDHVGDCEGPCRRACPAGMDIPGMLRAIADGRPGDALRIVKAHIALPAALGRVCPAPCEKVCRRSPHDAPVAICALKGHVAELDLAAERPYRPALRADRGTRVAVAGAGPAGLAAAFELRRAGHAVTLFERESAPGGGLRAPELAERLPGAVLEAEIAGILRLGIELAPGMALGRDVSAGELRSRFDAVVLACGRLAPDEAERLGLPAGPHGIAADHASGTTALPGVFACGNATSPGRMAVRALAAGRAAALSADRFLRGRPIETRRRRYDHRVPGRLDPGELAELLRDADPSPRAAVSGADLAPDAARREAARCLHCDCRKRGTCRLRRFADEANADPHAWRPDPRRRIEVQRSDRVRYEPGKCIACGLCVRIAERAREPLGLTFIGRGFHVRIGVPFNEALDRGLERAAIECIAACPTGALTRGK